MSKQRVKGNFKPSSSSRAATLLSQSGYTSMSGFGFGAAESENLDFEEGFSSDPKLRAVLKQLTKRDPVTKVKALNELISILNNATEDIVIESVQTWTRLYCKLSMDAQFSVREGAHRATKAYATKLGKSLKPFVKSIVPLLLIGEQDPYVVTSDAASSAFQTIFPGPKRPVALAYCFTNILECCCEILLELNVLKFADQLPEEVEDTGIRNTRNSVCCFAALRTLLESLPCDTNPSLVSILSEDSGSFIDDSKFWSKFSKHSTLAVKAAFFSFLHALLQHYSVVCKIRDRQKQIIGVLVNAMECGDEPIARHVWPGLLTALHVFDDFFEFVSLSKAFLPKLNFVARHSCNGCGSVIAPHFLPLLSKLVFPTAVEKDSACSKFLLSIEEGLLPLFSKPLLDESAAAMLKAYCDCAFFCIATCSTVESINRVLVSIDTTLSGSLIVAHQQFVSVASQLGKFTQLCGSKQIVCGGVQPTAFVELLSKIVQKSALDNNEDIVLNTSALLAEIQRELPLEAIDRLVSKFLVELWERFRDRSDIVCLRGTSMVIAIHHSEAVLLEFCDSLKPKLLSVYDFVSKEIIPRVVNADECTSSAATHLLKAFFVLLSCVSTLTEGLVLIQHLSKAEDVGIRSQFLSFLIRSRCLEVVSQWMLSPDFEKWILESFRFTGDFQTGTDSKLKKWFQAIAECFGLEVHGKQIMSMDLQQKLIDQLVLCVDSLAPTSSQQEVLPSLISLVCEVAQRFMQTCVTSKSMHVLLLRLFQLLFEDYGLPGDICSKIRETCNLGIVLFMRANGGYFHEECFVVMAASALNSRLLQGCQTQGQGRTDNLVDLTLFVIDTVHKSTSGDANSHHLSEEACHVLLLYVLPSPGKLLTVKNTLNSVHCVRSVVTGELFAGDRLLASRSVLLDEAQQCIEILCSFVTILCRLKIATNSDENSTMSSQLPFTSDSVSEDGYNVSAEFFCHENVIEIILLSLTSQCAAVELSWHQSISPSIIDLVHKVVAMLEKLKTNVIEKSPEVIRKITQVLFDTAVKKGGIFTVAFGTFADRFVPIDRRQQFIEPLLDRLIVEEAFTSDCQSELQTFYFLFQLCDNDNQDVILTSFCQRLSDPILQWSFKFACGFRTLQPSLKLKIFTDWMVMKDDMYGNLAFNKNLSTVDTPSLLLCGWLHRFLQSVFPLLDKLNEEQKDFILCALFTSFHSINESSVSTNEERFFVFCTYSLFTDCARFVKTTTKSIEDEVRAAFCDEWEEFFLEGASPLIITQFFKFSSLGSTSSLHQQCKTVIAEAVSFCPKKFLTSVDLPLLLSPEMDKLKYPEQLQSLLLQTFPFLRQNCWAVQLAAFEILKKVICEIAQYEFSNNESGSDLDPVTDQGPSSDDQGKPLPSTVLYVLEQSYNAIEAQILSENLDVQPGTVVFHQAAAYVFSLKLTLEYLRVLTVEQRVGYSKFLYRSGMFGQFILFLFCLMPENPPAFLKNYLSSDHSEYVAGLLECFISAKQPSAAATEKPVAGNISSKPFTEEPVFSFGACEVEKLHLFSCHIYYELVKRFPALLRKWWKSQNKKYSSMVERFTAKFVSPVMSVEEMNNISESNKDLGTMKVSVRPVAREVLAVYPLEEMNMELVLSLPINYPLGTVEVGAGARVGVEKEQWRKWMLQLNIFLMQQNGSLLDGLLMWKRNIDKHLEGVEDCMICFMAVHGSNYQLPKISCKQCKKRFHASCLYKWFNTSNNASCPLCRTQF